MKPPPDDGPRLQAIQQLTAQVGWIALSDGPAVAEGTPSAVWQTRTGGAAWTRLGAPPRTRIDRLRFVDEQHGWALAFVLSDRARSGCAQASAAAPCRGVVLTTADGGQTWQERLSIPLDPNGGGVEPLRQLDATDASHAWVIAQSGPCGHDGCPQQQILATSDGGGTWRAVFGTDERGLIPYLLRLSSPEVGWAVARRFLRSGEVVVGTTDGGRTWAAVEDTVGAIALDAAGERDAWVLTNDDASCSSSSCATYELLHTGDRGATWSSYGNPKAGGCGAGRLRGPVFADPRIGYLGLDLGAAGVDAPGGIMASGDGGRGWRCLTPPPNVTAISAADPRNAWAVSADRTSGRIALYRSTDAGATWAAVPLPVAR